MIHGPSNVKSVILFHACARNSTRVDPKSEEWKDSSKAVQQKKLFLYFDIAYQGFASDGVARDAFTVQHFMKNGVLCWERAAQPISCASPG